MAVDDREWDQHHRTVRDRLNWTAVISNAALIVAIVGGAMQASDPRTVLNMFAGSLILFGLGATAGFLSAELTLSADIEWKRGTAWWEDSDGPAKQLVALNVRVREISTSPEAMMANAQELLQINAKVQELAPKAEAGHAESQAKLVRSMVLNRFAAAGRFGSMLLCAGGFAWLLVIVGAVTLPAFPWR